MTIDELKQQKRWTLWRLEPGPNGKPTKPPCSPEGFKHDITNPANLRTFVELEPLASKFSGLGYALGEFDGVAFGLQPFMQERDLRALAGTVDAFHAEQPARVFLIGETVE